MAVYPYLSNLRSSKGEEVRDVEFNIRGMSPIVGKKKEEGALQCAQDDAFNSLQLAQTHGTRHMACFV
jgi:hypothetical protein